MSDLLRDGNSRVMLFGVAAVTLICAFVVINSYRTQIEIYEDKELAKLSGIANTLALQIDGDDHWQLVKQYPDKDAIASTDQDVHYRAIHKLLAAAKEVNGLNVPVYTMVYKAREMQFYLGVTSSENPYWLHDYSRFPREIVENLEYGGTLEPYQSENGHWLAKQWPWCRPTPNSIVF